MKALVSKEMLEVTSESKTGKYVGKELENLISDKDYFVAYALALSDYGVTAKEITHCIGYEGKEALESLMEKGIVKKDENNIYRAIQPNKGIILSFKILKRHIRLLAENYKTDNKKNNYIYYKIETLNKEGRKRLYEIHKETHRQVQNLMEDKRYKGDTPTFSVGFFDMFFLNEKGEARGRDT